MSSPTRKLKKVWLVTSILVGEPSPLCVTGTFRSAYKLATFELGMSKPNISERKARLLYKRNKLCFMYNIREFETLEEALYSPVGKAAKIEEVPVRRT